jgi:CSLREA domain-containing protein
MQTMPRALRISRPTTGRAARRSRVHAIALAVSVMLAGCRDVAPPTAPLSPTQRPRLTQSALAPEVNSLADPGDGMCDAAECTLREAIGMAAPGATITFAPGVTGTIALRGTLFTPRNTPLRIVGPGAPGVIVERPAGNIPFRVLAIGHSNTVDADGAPVLNTVEISDLTIRGGYDIDLGGGIYVTSGNHLRCVRCTITGNRVAPGGYGASTVRGGGIYVGGAPDAPSQLTLVASTVAGNTADGTYNSVGGLGLGGGIYLAAHATAVLVHTTVTANSAIGRTQKVGGIVSWGTVTLRNSVLAGNDIGIAGFDDQPDLMLMGLGSTFAAQSSLIGVSGGLLAVTGPDATDANGNVVGVVPSLLKLAALADNGGATRTVALLPGSPAIDRADPAICAAAAGALDQRGVSRPQGARCDMGAFELVPTAAATAVGVVSSLAVFPFGASVTFMSTVTSGGAPVTSGTVSFHDGGTCAAPGAAIAAPVGVNGSGQAQASTSALSVGAHTIVACYGGTAAYLASGGSVAQQVDPSPTSTMLTVPATQQYGDRVTLTATVIPASVNGSAPSGTVQFAIAGANVGAPVALVNGVATVAGVPVTLAPNAVGYGVQATFVSAGGDFTGSADLKTLLVTAEDAAVAYGTSNPVAVKVASAGGTSPTVTLSATLSERLPDAAGAGSAAPGDFTRALATMQLVPIGPGGIVPPSAPCTLGAVATDANGYGSRTVTCTFASVAVNTYAVQVSVTGGYYAGGVEDVLTVYDPSLGFASGGGSFAWPGTGERTTFGLTMKYNKSGTSPQGSLLVVRHMSDGTVYRFKSNALDGLALGPASGATGYATLSGKGTYLEPGWADARGNVSFTAYVEDRNEPGTGTDRFWLQVAGGMSMAAPAATNAQPLTGGNIVVPHGGR